MQNTKEKLEIPVGFRITARMDRKIKAHQAKRRLPDFSDAARELLAMGYKRTGGVSSELKRAITEARRARVDPVAAIRNALAEVERDHALEQVAQAVAPLTASGVQTASHSSHSSHYVP